MGLPSSARMSSANAAVMALADAVAIRLLLTPNFVFTDDQPDEILSLQNQHIAKT